MHSPWRERMGRMQRWCSRCSNGEEVREWPAYGIKSKSRWVMRSCEGEKTSVLTPTCLWSKGFICIPDYPWMTSALKGRGHTDLSEWCTNLITFIFKNSISILPSLLLIPIPFECETGISVSICSPFESHSFLTMATPFHQWKMELVFSCTLPAAWHCLKSNHWSIFCFQ